MKRLIDCLVGTYIKENMMLFVLGWSVLVVALLVWCCVIVTLRVLSVDEWLDVRKGYEVSKKIYDYEKEKD